jgi:hypothetical protein
MKIAETAIWSLGNKHRCRRMTSLNIISFAITTYLSKLLLLTLN